MFSTPETSVHVRDENREISPLNSHHRLARWPPSWKLWWLLKSSLAGGGGILCRPTTGRRACFRWFPVETRQRRRQPTDALPVWRQGHAKLPSTLRFWRHFRFRSPTTASAATAASFGHFVNFIWWVITCLFTACEGSACNALLFVFIILTTTCVK